MTGLFGGDSRRVGEWDTVHVERFIIVDYSRKLEVLSPNGAIKDNADPKTTTPSGQLCTPRWSGAGLADNLLVPGRL